MTPDPLLRVEDLEVRYGPALALSGVSLDVPAGGCLAVLGANGAGKSTLAEAISGGVPPAAGRVVFDGEDLTGVSAHQVARRGIAHVPEGRGIFPGLSVTDNLRIALRQADDDPDAALDRAFELFPRLAERRAQRAGTLSGGEQQMLALSRVLAAPPRLLVADEMSLGLAPQLIDLVFQTLRRAREAGVTIVLIEQYVDRALALADDAVVLNRGRVAWRGPAEEAASAALAEYLGEGASSGDSEGASVGDGDGAPSG